MAESLIRFDVKYANLDYGAGIEFWSHFKPFSKPVRQKLLLRWILHMKYSLTFWQRTETPREGNYWYIVVFCGKAFCELFAHILSHLQLNKLLLKFRMISMLSIWTLLNPIIEQLGVGRVNIWNIEGQKAKLANILIELYNVVVCLLSEKVGQSFPHDLCNTTPIMLYFDKSYAITIDHIFIGLLWGGRHLVIALDI